MIKAQPIQIFLLKNLTISSYPIKYPFTPYSKKQLIRLFKFSAVTCRVGFAALRSITWRRRDSSYILKLSFSQHRTLHNSFQKNFDHFDVSCLGINLNFKLIVTLLRMLSCAQGLQSAYLSSHIDRAKYDGKENDYWTFIRPSIPMETFRKNKLLPINYRYSEGGTGLKKFCACPSHLSRSA